MGLESIIEESKGERLPDSVTLGELRDELGDEVVRRGIGYMSSLIEADNNYRDVDKEDMKEGYSRAGVGGDVDKVAEKWASEMKDNGLGLQEE